MSYRAAPRRERAMVSSAKNISVRGDAVLRNITRCGSAALIGVKLCDNGARHRDAGSWYRREKHIQRRGIGARRRSDGIMPARLHLAR